MLQDMTYGQKFVVLLDGAVVQIPSSCVIVPGWPNQAVLDQPVV